MAEDDIYTQDGTVDIKGNPADRRKTGHWKACRFILGIILSVFAHLSSLIAPLFDLHSFVVSDDPDILNSI